MFIGWSIQLTATFDIVLIKKQNIGLLKPILQFIYFLSQIHFSLLYSLTSILILFIASIIKINKMPYWLLKFSWIREIEREWVLQNKWLSQWSVNNFLKLWWGIWKISFLVPVGPTTLQFFNCGKYVCCSFFNTKTI